MNPAKYINIHTHCLPEEEAVIALIDLSNKSELSFRKELYYSFGIHPWYLTAENAKMKLAQLSEAIQKGVDAIGEAGLDKLKGPEMELQEGIFLEVIRLSEEGRKPLIIHCVKAWEQLLHARKTGKATLPWVIHGFQGSLQLAQQLLEHGMYLSFGQKLLQSDSLKEVFLALPLNRIFLETDDAPISIESVYDCAAELLGYSVETLKEAMWDNFKVFFSGNNKLQTYIS